MWGRQLHHQGSSKGFTLLEVLIALGVVAVVSLLSWRGLTEVLSMRDRLNEVDQNLQNVTAVFNQMEVDFARVEQGVDKGLRVGDLVTLSEQGVLMVYTIRSKEVRSDQFQVGWVYRDNALFRESVGYFALEEASVSQPIPIKGMRVRFWLEGKGWADAVEFGEVVELEHVMPKYQGTPNPLNLSGFAQVGGEFVRAIEVLITQTNGKSVIRILNVGGVT